jgi:RNA polymerase sigma factor (sigma-70 family)
MAAPSSPSPRWAEGLPLLLARLRAERGDAARAALWRVLHAGLYAALRAQAGAILAVSREDLEDLASAKALELLQQAEGARWGEAGRSPGELAGYVWRVARNGLVDLARQRGREAPLPEDGAAWDHVFVDRIDREAGPVEWMAAEEFVTALERCVAKLAPRARTAWWLRVGLERPSREIATRLEVAAGHVDVIVQRARIALGQCMTASGHAHADVHAQAFVLLWARRQPGEQGGSR